MILCLNCDVRLPGDALVVRLPRGRGRARARPRAPGAHRGHRGRPPLDPPPPPLPRAHEPRPPHPPAGGAARAAIPRRLPAVRRMHAHLPKERDPLDDPRGGSRGDLDAPRHPAHRLLRLLVHALRTGLPLGRAEAADARGEERVRTGAAGETGHRGGGSDEMHPVVAGDAVPRLRGGLPRLPESHHRGRRPGPRPECGRGRGGRPAVDTFSASAAAAASTSARSKARRRYGSIPSASLVRSSRDAVCNCFRGRSPDGRRERRPRLRRPEKRYSSRDVRSVRRLSRLPASPGTPSKIPPRG